jgi:Holliday junction DNA helicase RuvA
MIGWLHGKIIDYQHPGKLVIDVKGVGYDVETSLSTFFQLTAKDFEVGLHIHTIVREDALLLFGFLERQERALFRALIKVNGVGPKLAMTILSSISIAEFIHCIHEPNALLLTKLPGVGKKTAERLIMEMKDIIKEFAPTPGFEHLHARQESSQQQEAISALEALGYKQQEAMNAIKKIEGSNDKSAEQLIRQALQFLANR